MNLNTIITLSDVNTIVTESPKTISNYEEIRKLTLVEIISIKIHLLRSEFVLNDIYTLSDFCNEEYFNILGIPNFKIMILNENNIQHTYIQSIEDGLSHFHLSILLYGNVIKHKDIGYTIYSSALATSMLKQNNIYLEDSIIEDLSKYYATYMSKDMSSYIYNMLLKRHVILPIKKKNITILDIYSISSKIPTFDGNIYHYIIREVKEQLSFEMENSKAYFNHNELSKFSHNINLRYEDILNEIIFNRVNNILSEPISTYSKFSLLDLLEAKDIYYKYLGLIK